jgi:hypothetical protein
VDFVIDPTVDQLEALARDLESELDVSRPAMAEAPARRGTFGAVHDPTSFKIDFFLKRPAPLNSERMTPADKDKSWTDRLPVRAWADVPAVLMSTCRPPLTQMITRQQDGAR